MLTSCGKVCYSSRVPPAFAVVFLIYSAWGLHVFGRHTPSYWARISNRMKYTYGLQTTQELWRCVLVFRFCCSGLLFYFRVSSSLSCCLLTRVDCGGELTALLTPRPLLSMHLFLSTPCPPPPSVPLSLPVALPIPVLLSAPPPPRSSLPLPFSLSVSLFRALYPSFFLPHVFVYHAIRRYVESSRGFQQSAAAFLMSFFPESSSMTIITDENENGEVRIGFSI